MYKDLFGNHEVRSDTYFVFHDESLPDKRWLLIGLSFVKEKDIDSVYKLLRKEREKEGYYGEIHFSHLPKSFNGEYGTKARVARAWIRLFERGLSNIIHFLALLWIAIVQLMTINDLDMIFTSITDLLPWLLKLE